MNTVTPLHPEPTAPPMFADFWALCPTQPGHKRAWAEDKFNHITSENGLNAILRDKDTGDELRINWKATAQEICDGMRKYRATFYIKGRFELGDTTYAVNPAKWLNDGGWT